MSVQKNKSLLTLEETVQATNGIHVLGLGDFYFSSVKIDSRCVEKGSLFIPLIGQNQDGHAYIPQALENGASVVFICLKNYENDSNFFTGLSLKYPEVFFIAVENTMTALQRAAGRYVEKFPDLIKIGITGSSGKTTTKEIAATLLRKKYRVVTNEGNLNSETGLPLSVFNIKKEDQVGIFEMGMNRKNEIAEIAAVLKPRFAIITNIGTAHIGILGSRQAIAEEKANIFSHFKGIGTAFIPKDDDFADFLTGRVDGNVVYYGTSCDADISDVVDLGLAGTKFCISRKETILPLPGKYNFTNALAALSLAKFLGLSSDQLSSGIKEIKSIFGRSQILHGKYTIVQDCYNANPDSMEKAIDFISSVTSPFKKILVLGDMRELGNDSKREHEKIGAQVANSSASYIFLVGDEMKAAFEVAKKTRPNTELFYFPSDSLSTMEKVAAAIREKACKDDIILVKGSRGMALERIIKKLEGL